MPGVRYVSHRLHLAPGDSIYLYTDGITEQVNPKMELFGEDRLLYAYRDGHNVLTLGKALEDAPAPAHAPEAKSEKVPLAARIIRKRP